MSRRVLAVCFLCASAWAQNSFTPSTAVTTQASVAFSTSSSPAAAVTTQGDATTTFTGQPLTVNPSTSFSVTTFFRPTDNNLFSPSLSFTSQFDLNATYSSPPLTMTPTTNMAAAFTYVPGPAAYTFSPTASLASTSSTVNKEGWTASAPSMVQADLNAVFSVKGPTATLATATTGNFDTSGIGFSAASISTAMTATLASNHQMFSPSLSINTQMDANGTYLLAGPTMAATMSASLAFDSSGNALTAAESFSMSVTSFLQNVTNRSLSASLGPTLAMLPNLNTVLTSTQVSDTTTAQAQLGDGPATNAAPATAMSASFRAAYNLNPVIAVTTSPSVPQFSSVNNHTVQALAGVTTGATVQQAETNTQQVSSTFNMAVGSGLGEQASASDVIAMNCSFTVGRFNPSRKIMLVISDT